MFSENENLNPVAKLNINFSMLALLFVSLLISCAVMYYIVMPMRKEAKIIKIGNEMKEESMGRNNLFLAKIVKANNESRKMDAENVEKIKNFISNRNNYEDYLIHIVKLANSKNIKINDLSVNKNENDLRKKDDGIFNEMEINLAASSGFLNLLGFLKSLEKSIPFVQEESIVISAGDEEENADKYPNIDTETTADSILDYEIKLKFYYY